MEIIKASTQPSSPYTIYSDSSLANGLISHINVGYPQSQSSNALLTPTGSTVERGVGKGTPTDTGTYTLTVPVESASIHNQLTMVAVLYTVNPTANPSSSDHRYCGSYSTAIRARGYNAGGIEGRAYYHPNYNGELILNSPSNLSRGLNVVVYRFQRNGLCELFINGVSVASATSADMPVKLDSPLAAKENSILKDGSTSAASVLGNFIYNRYLSNDEIAAISSNPWQVFAKQLERNVMLPKYVPCSKQPQGPAEIDWGNPISRELYGAWHGGSPLNEAIRGLASHDGANPQLIYYRLTREGTAHTSDVSSSSIGKSYRLRNQTPWASPFTIVARFRIRSIPAGDRSVVSFSNISGESAAIDIKATGKIQGYTIRANTTIESDSTYTVGTWLTVVYVGKEGDFRLWINGVKQVAQGIGSTSSFQGRQNIGLSGSDADIVTALTFSRALSDAEVVSISANPWQLFHQRLITPQNITTKENRRPIIRESNMLGTSKRKLSDVNLLKVLKKPMMKQPQEWAEIDWGGVGAGLATASNFGAGPIGIAQGWAPSGSGASFVAAPGGVGASANGSGGFNATNPITIAPGASTSFAVMLTFRLNATGQGPSYALFQLQGAGQTAIIYGYVAGTFELYTDGHTGSSPRGSSGIQINDLNTHTLIYSYDGTVFSGYLDGRRVFSTPLTFALPASAPSDGRLLRSNVADYLRATVFGHATFSRALSDAAARSLSANPWQIFRQSSNLPLLK